MCTLLCWYHGLCSIGWVWEVCQKDLAEKNKKKNLKWLYTRSNFGHPSKSILLGSRVPTMKCPYTLFGAHFSRSLQRSPKGGTCLVFRSPSGLQKGHPDGEMNGMPVKCQSCSSPYNLTPLFIMANVCIMCLDNSESAITC